MSFRITGVRSLSAAATLFLLCSSAASQMAFRPLSDFLSRQGTFAGGLYWPPVQNYVGWGNENGSQFGLVDYAGLANKYIRTTSAGAMDLGTQITGYIQEDYVTGGQGMVTVYLQTRNALTFGCPVAKYPSLGFGYQAPEVLAGKPAALADCTMILVFLNPVFGAPLPDVLQLFNAPLPGQQALVLFMQASAKGALRTPSGYADGTPGAMYINQLALMYMNPPKWTIELVDVFPVVPIW